MQVPPPTRGHAALLAAVTAALAAPPVSEAPAVVSAPLAAPAGIRAAAEAEVTEIPREKEVKAVIEDGREILLIDCSSEDDDDGKVREEHI